jgi:hypothetical protein
LALASWMLHHRLQHKMKQWLELRLEPSLKMRLEPSFWS